MLENAPVFPAGMLSSPEDKLFLFGLWHQQITGFERPGKNNPAADLDVLLIYFRQ
jgi:hypothetical protein